MYKDIDYSVIIRTTGKAGEKYKRLLESITKLSPLPKEIIVVLPEGYDLPEDKIGNETFYFCPKGMVKQRVYGIEKCKTKYAFITDDDIAFESNFIQKLYKPIKEDRCDISIGPLLNFFPQTKKRIIASIIMGAAIPTIFHKERYNTVLMTTGYSYNRKIEIKKEKYYETQSAAWTCFFANIDKLRTIHFEDEMVWLDKNGYSAFDDSAMFYKAWICGIKTLVVSDAIYDHLDARTSTQGNNDRVDYAIGFNTVVFWHRFIFKMQHSFITKLWSFVCLEYRIILQICFQFLHNRKYSSAYYSGYRAGMDWLKTNEYKRIKSLKW